jgi:hypothetical protein
MVEEEPVGMKDDFVVRLREFLDMTLEDLRRARESKDSDDKDTQAIRSVGLKLIRIWDRVRARDLARTRSGLGQASRKNLEKTGD